MSPGRDPGGVAMTGSGADRGVDIGLFGKLPARGDFVRIGLPGRFVVPWDAWLQRVLAASRQRMGARWLPAFLEAPVWRFTLPPGACGGGAVLGLLMPSVDRVGRYFPLTLAAVFATGFGAPADAVPWLDACETAGRKALDEDATPEEIARRMPLLRAEEMPDAAAIGAWWTEGGPRVAAARLTLAELPDAEQFAAMLGADAPVREKR
jgi:type VI secretion system protein ImpM